MPIFVHYATIFDDADATVRAGAKYVVTTKPPPDTMTAPARLPAWRGDPLLGSPILIVMLAAFAVLLPTFFLGIPSGHDFEFHLNSWMEVLRQWKQGILYPRWAALAHYGFGEARFVFYPPASWMLGAALGSFLPWKMVPGAYEWVALTLSGCSMFLLARRFLHRRDAIFVAALYAANPYHIVIVYWRSAFAELLAGALLPLLLLYVLRSEKEGRKTILPLGLIVAAAWITNVPSAVMVTYSLALLAVIGAILRRSPRILVIASEALLLGFALAAFYLVPAACEQKWVEIAQVLSPGVRPQDNFLFTFMDDQDHNRFNLLISLVATAQIILVAASGFMSRRWRIRAREAWWTSVAWGGAATVLMLSFSFLLYRILPEMRFVQLPLRWLLCLNVGFALLLTMASRSWLLRALACAVMLAVLVWVWHRVQPPWWDNAADVAEMQDNQQSGSGYEGADEYVPTGADAYEINKDAQRVAFEGDGSPTIHLTQWGPESRAFTANVNRPGKLVLKLFNYPAWQVEIKGRPVKTEIAEITGQMIVPVEAGENEIRITFVRTQDRTIGGLISFGTVLLVLGWTAFRRTHVA
ncbi:MAG TPA: 6-pyruvoyl-tetrahydropterin synthase-related protein [Terriglobales bacterium]|nr:6-pyruvoyl-tetrahydropterin synthase-related protein [Terriglobales bacterium]